MAARVKATASTYDRFLREGGLERVLTGALSARSADERLELSVLRVELGEPPLDPETCRQRGETFGAPLTIHLGLIRWERADEDAPPQVADVRELTLSLAPVPLMTDTDTLVLDGVDHTLEAAGKDLPGLTLDEGSARLTPYLGVPLELAIDRGLLVARLDGGPKLHATLLLRGLGMTSIEILQAYHDVQEVHLDAGGALALSLEDEVIPTTWIAAADVRAPGGAVIVPAGGRLSPALLRRLREAGVTRLPATLDDLAGCVAADDVIDEDTGEVHVEPNERLTADRLARLRGRRVMPIKVAWIDETGAGTALQRTLERDGIDAFHGPLRELVQRFGSMEAAAITAARYLRGAAEIDEETALSLFRRLLGWDARYDLLAAGRGELLARLHAGAERAPCPDSTTLLLEDVQRLIGAVLGRGGAQRDGAAPAADDEAARRWAEEKLCELAFRLDLDPIAAAVQARLRGETELRDEILERAIPPLSWLSARHARGASEQRLRAEDIEALAEAYGPGLPLVRRHAGYRLPREG